MDAHNLLRRVLVCPCFRFGATCDVPSSDHETSGSAEKCCAFRLAPVDGLHKVGIIHHISRLAPNRVKKNDIRTEALGRLSVKTCTFFRQLLGSL